MVTGSAKWSLLRHADALLLPSHQENFGVAVAEALAVGTPAHISDAVNIWREVTSDGAGVAAPDTLEGATTLLKAALGRDAATLAGVRARSRQCYERRFHPTAAAASWRSVFLGGGPA
jgi:glycosyltransferase involved in cell wall biosynthesis